MKTLHIKIKDKEIYRHLLWFLNKFNSEEIEILESDKNFKYIQEEFRHELRELDSGKSNLFDLQELDEELEKIISSNEG